MIALTKFKATALVSYLTEEGMRARIREAKLACEFLASNGGRRYLQDKNNGPDRNEAHLQPLGNCVIGTGRALMPKRLPESRPDWRAPIKQLVFGPTRISTSDSCERIEAAPEPAPRSPEKREPTPSFRRTKRRKRSIHPRPLAPPSHPVVPLPAAPPATPQMKAETGVALLSLLDGDPPDEEVLNAIATITSFAAL